MISTNHGDPDAMIHQSGELPTEKQARMGIPPIPVKDVARNHHHLNLSMDGELDDIFQCATRRGSNLLNRSTLVALQTFERAIQMKVSCVQKT